MVWLSLIFGWGLGILMNRELLKTKEDYEEILVEQALIIKELKKNNLFYHYKNNDL